MKTMRFGFGRGQFCVLALCALGCTASVMAQTNTSNSIPVVTIEATQPVATPPDKPGTFTVYRQGGTNAALNVYYQIGGSASNGVDYARISNFVFIGAGATSNTITITPATNSPSTATKTVVLHLAPSPLMTPVNYAIGSPNTAVVYITPPGVTNVPPFVDIFSPTDGQVFYTPTNITLLARASEPGGTITNVEFFAGATDLGRGMMVVLDPPGVNGVTGPVYFLNWPNVPTNNYSLTAVATDAGGISATSAPVDISVLPGPGPTNIPPVVRIVSPANGAVFRAPLNIPLFAYAHDADGFVTTVEFFAGTNSLGFGRPIPLPASGVSPIPAIYPTNLYFLLWSNPPAGAYALTAKATDNGGDSTVSAPVNITVLPPLPPPTNRPPIVSIVATDPLAIEGTNCWVWPGETNASPTWAAWPTAVCRSFTNCGPKTATFTVFRLGDTNGDVTVSYDIGGSASNGVDYVALSGSVTVPSGERRALITIVPIDDGPPDIDKTVVLRLTPSTNTPPDYLVGIPARAAAIILDSTHPRPVAAMLPGQCFHFVTAGPDGAWYSIEYSTNLVDWIPLCTNQVVQGSVDFVDPDAQSDPHRYYRTVPLAGPPLE